MTTDQFWTIIEASCDQRVEANGRKLFEQLCILNEQQIIVFDRLWREHAWNLYTNPLWGVVHLARHGCSEERFRDWRNWFVSRGREVFQTARDHPDELVSVIDAAPEAGKPGLVEVISRALRARNSRWEDSMPEHPGLQTPSHASGADWGTDEDLRPVIPKTYARYTGKDPGPVASPSASSLPTAPPVDPRNGTDQPPAKKPWWKVWG